MVNFIQVGLTVLLAVSPFFLLAFEKKPQTYKEFLSSSMGLKTDMGFKTNLYLLAQNEKENKLNKVINSQIENHLAGAKSQEKISKLAEDTRDLFSEYEIVLRQIESTRTYNQQLKKLIEDQENEIQSIRTQIVEVKQTGKDILPLMLEMIKNLDEFISLDIPFLMEERKKRLQNIKGIMDRADVSVSEKYRRLMEAYQIEIEYGKTIEAYQGLQEIENKTINVNYLRIGRIALIYQSLDGAKQAYWDQKKKSWEPLSARYSKAIENGLKTARKEQAPTLLTVPVPSPIKQKKAGHL